eukprot:scaffold255232_cov33-Tisochrysis_lutea.AAC.3
MCCRQVCPRVRHELRHGKDHGGVSEKVDPKVLLAELLGHEQVVLALQAWHEGECGSGCGLADADDGAEGHRREGRRCARCGRQQGGRILGCDGYEPILGLGGGCGPRSAK